MKKYILFFVILINKGKEYIKLLPNSKIIEQYSINSFKSEKILCF